MHATETRDVPAAIGRYGVADHRDHSCDGVIRQLARGIDASTLRPGFPAYFPRAIQAAIWIFCTASELDSCNAANVGEARRCKTASECPVAGCLRKEKGEESMEISYPVELEAVDASCKVPFNSLFRLGFCGARGRHNLLLLLQLVTGRWDFFLPPCLLDFFG